MADAVTSLTSGTEPEAAEPVSPTTPPPAVAEPAASPTPPAGAQVEDSRKPANPPTISHKKVISPLDSRPTKPDIQALYAAEQAKETATQTSNPAPADSAAPINHPNPMTPTDIDSVAL